MVTDEVVETDSTDHELLATFQRSRDESAFRQLVERHHGMVFGIAKKIVGCPHSAEDILQATFMIMARDAKKIRKRGSLASWLYGVAFRTAARFAKQRARNTTRTIVEDIPVSTDPLERLNAQFEQNLVLEELSQLPLNIRSAMVLRYLSGKSNAEVADEMRLSESAVEGRLKRGRSQLRMRLARQGVTFAAVIVVLDSIKRNAVAMNAPQLVEKTAEVALSGNAGAQAQLANSEILQFAEQEMLKMTTTKMIQSIAVACLSLGILSGGWAMLGNSQLFAEGGNGSDPFGEVIVVEGVTTKKKDSQFQIVSDPLTVSSFDAVISKANTDGNRLRNVGYYSVPIESEAEVKIVQALHRNIAQPIEIFDETLQTAVEMIAELHEIPIVFDSRSLNEESIEPSSETVNLKVPRIQLANALQLLLEPLNLTTVVRNEVLVVTTDVAAEEALVTRVYKRDPSWRMTEEQMVEAISKAAGPHSWDTVGGPGSISVVNDGLVISNAQSVHRAINVLLRQLDQLYSNEPTHSPQGSAKARR